MAVRRFHWKSVQIIALGFLVLILFGALLLSLPISSASQNATSFVDSLFTATSATCVTGLTVYDTFSHWSLFGQLVILCLIQVGGLGFVTFALLVSLITGRRIGLRNRSLMQEAVNAPQLGGIVRMTKFILLGTLLIELTGALLLSFSFVPRFGFWQGIYFSVFHSVSAFCNAGFDLMGISGSMGSSLVSVQQDLYLLSVLMFLIVLGGLGFFVWRDLAEKGLRIRKYSLQTKLVLSVTLFLIFVPAVGFFLLETKKGGSMAEMSLPQQIVSSLFQSVTARTAGFSSVDQSKLSDAAIFLMLPLMFIGGSSGSTAGGLKTTTFAVLLLSALSFVRQKEEMECFGRRVDGSVLKRAVALLMILLLCASLGMLVLMTADGVPLRDAAFEAVSAVATVGLSTGITAGLSTLSKLVLAALMFIGRVGCLTLLFSFAFKPGVGKIRTLPSEQVAVG